MGDSEESKRGVDMRVQACNRRCGVPNLQSLRRGGTRSMPWEQ